MLFTFKNTNNLHAFKWTGISDQFQWSNDSFIGMGGGSGGRFGIYIQNDMYKGSSSKTTTFDNEILSFSGDFHCQDIEVWGLD